MKKSQSKKQKAAIKKHYIVMVLIPEEPYIIYYCGVHDNKPLMHEIVGLVKQMPLKEAEKIFNAFNISNKEATVCLIEWTKFAEIYQWVGPTKENFIKESLKSK